jgi:tRNA threonylcarbamoyladenosine biosynthesis protein TsaE
VADGDSQEACGECGVREFKREKRLKTRSEAGTLGLGQMISELLVAPKLVVLTGELGAGKTTLVKGWVEALGMGKAGDVTSPTFSLMHEYSSKSGKKLFHLDLYRLETERELATVGLEEIVEEPGALVLVEWGEKFASVMERADAIVVIEPLEGDERSLYLRWTDR